MPSYNGNVVEIQLGRSGFKIDDANRLLPPDSLIKASNIRYGSGVCEKEFGSQKWNSVALPGGILAGIDHRTTESERSLFAACNDGKIYKLDNPYSQLEITGSPTTLSFADGCNFVSGGAEETSNPRKLFIFSQNAYPQVINGNSSTRNDMTKGLPDWQGNSNPVDGIIFRNRMFVWTRFGNEILGSDPTDHEDFLTAPLPIAVYPGAGERIAAATVYQKRLFVAKYPEGIFILNDTDPDADNWYFEKINDSVGGMASRAVIQWGNDVFLKNQFGGISSLSRTNVIDDANASDLFGFLKNQDYVHENISVDPDVHTHAIFDAGRRCAYFSFRSITGTQNDRICLIDLKDFANPRISWLDKDQPNCLLLWRDNFGKSHPFYGANDGFFYDLASENRWVGTDTSGTAFLMDLQTPHLDFGGQDPVLASSVKQFDFLEVVYEPEGDWDLSVDVFIDGRFSQTLSFHMALDKEGSELDTDPMTLDNGNLDQQIEQSRIRELKGAGKKISFRCYNSGNGQNCRIAALRVYFKRLGIDQKR